MKGNDGTGVLTGFAHALTWVAALLLVFGPVYQGVAITAVTPGDAASESTRFTGSLIAVNGLRVLPILLVPVVLTGLALLAVLLTSDGQTRRKVVLWISAVLLLGFCALGIWTFGLFYAPAALALVCLAILGSFSRAAETGVG